MAVEIVQEQTQSLTQQGTVNGYAYVQDGSALAIGAKGLIYNNILDPIEVLISDININRLTLAKYGLAFDATPYGPVNGAKIFFEYQLVDTGGGSTVPVQPIRLEEIASAWLTNNGNLKVAINEGTLAVSTSAFSTLVAPTYIDGTENPLSTDLRGNLRVASQATAMATAAAPVYAEGSDNSLSVNLAGSLRTIDQALLNKITNVTPNTNEDNPTNNIQVSSYLMGWNGFSNKWQRIGSEATSFDGEGARTSEGGALSVEGYNKVLNRSGTWDRQRGDVYGTWVQGPAAAGEISTAMPVMIAGSDSDRVRTIRTDAGGRLVITGVPLVNSGTIDALAEAVLLPSDFEDQQSIGVQVLGTWDGTLRIQGTVDGVTWYALESFSPNADTPEIATSHITSNGFYQPINPQGFKTFRVVSTVWNSGSANITIGASFSAPAFTQVTATEDGENIPSYGVQVGASDGVDMHFLHCDIAGNLKVRQLEATSSGVTRVASSANTGQLLAANAARRGAAIYNESTAILYLKLGTTASTTDYTLQIVPGGYYEVPAWYSGRIDGIWAAANGAAQVTEIS